MGHFRDMMLQSHRGWALSILAAALLLRLIVPAGWMPGTAADGSMQIELCTGQGVVKAWVGHDGQIKDNVPSQSSIDQPCAFAGLSMAIAHIEPVVVMPAMLASVVPGILLSRSISIGRGLAAPPPPATGPPATL